jgi:hypothetical protein
MWRLMLLLGLFTIAVVACGPTAPPTPTPDMPAFADGEAIAVVKTTLSSTAATPRGVTGQRAVRAVRAGTGIAWEATNCLSKYERVREDWKETYEGNGVWLVSVDNEASTHYSAT